MRSGGSGLAKMDSENGGVWVATSCKVVRRWELGRSGEVRWNWVKDLSLCVLVGRSVRLGWDPGSMPLGENGPWCQWH